MSPGKDETRVCGYIYIYIYIYIYTYIYIYIKFDNAEFYPSISENLLKKSIVYAKSFTKIEDNAINGIKLAIKSLLFNKDGAWAKKGDDTLFDVRTGSFDGAEIFELVGLNFLDKLSRLI